MCQSCSCGWCPNRNNCSYLSSYSATFIFQLPWFLRGYLFKNLIKNHNRLWANPIILKYGFARRRTTGNVDTKYVYSGGRHLIGPDFLFKEFYAAAQFVSFSHIPIFTQDNLEVKITAELQYFVIKEDLKLLHDSYDIYYHSIIVNNAKDAIKVSLILVKSKNNANVLLKLNYCI